MSEVKKILAVTNNFPTPRFPEKGVFVMNILKEMRRQGIEVDVIAPISLGTEFKRMKRSPVKVDFEGLNVIQPYYLSIPQRFPRFRKAITRINDFLFGLAVWLCYRKKDYDLVYTHFLQSAIPVITFLRRNTAPILLNLGESDPWDYDIYYGKKGWLNYLQKVTLLVAVSKVNYDYVLSLDSNLKERTRYIPNGVNTNFFKPLDFVESRKKLGLDLATKYIVFCGHLDERKGPLRVYEAIKGTSIKGIFLGSNGPDVPVGDEVAYVGPVENGLVPLYLSACDAFVLPSRSEGMSNAVLEAMACCIPLVVSDKSFNTDFLTSEVATFVDPDNVADIKQGINAVLEAKRNAEMRTALKVFRDQFSIETRIKRILNFAAGN